MQRPEYKPAELFDGFFSFGKGVNAGIDPILLPKDQMANAVNTTVRGDFVHARPTFQKVALVFDQNTQGIFENGLFQGACAYQPDSGLDSLMVSISGHLFRVSMGSGGFIGQVSDVSIPADLDDATQLRAWMIQAEKWVIRTDGVSYPLFYDGTTSTRSIGDGAVTWTSTIGTQFSVPKQGFAVSAGGLTPGLITFANPFLGGVGATITIAPVGSFIITSLQAGNTIATLTNFGASNIGAVVKVGAVITWTSAGNQLPKGRETAYGMGRVWMALEDGKQFVASDLVGGSSGTLANDFRDSVLNITENDFLLGGGNFTIPGAYGEIRALCFTETLDSSLGQGALQVFTPNTVFSCNAPVDRTTWQTLTNPILTESAKGGGALSQWSTINANSDVLSRSAEGIRSLVLARREFNTWGNTSISREVQPTMDADSEDLLRFTSAVVFDNRFLLTADPVLVANHGTFFRKIVPINFDQNSSLQGKAPSVYDAQYWTGLNVLQLVKARIGTEERCYAFTYDEVTQKIELWQLMKSNFILHTDDYSRSDTPITWSFETVMDFGQKDPRTRQLLRLSGGELWVDELHGTVDFQVYYRPDSWPCWVPWHSWRECSTNPVYPQTLKPSFRPRMGLGEPTATPCDPYNNRPLREGYLFHIKVVVTGDCIIKGGRFGGLTLPETPWAKPICTPICDT